MYLIGGSLGTYWGIIQERKHLKSNDTKTIIKG